jgi:hypothetical protein
MLRMKRVRMVNCGPGKSSLARIHSFVMIARARGLHTSLDVGMKYVRSCVKLQDMLQQVAIVWT